MNLSDEYRRQFAWRSWSTILDALPSLSGRAVLDVGCAVGDLAALLAERGARVIGVDLNEDLLATARARGIPNARFVLADLRERIEVGEPIDLVWSSFSAAYFRQLDRALGDWCAALKPDGILAITEIDDFFAHRPLDPRTRDSLARYVADSLAAGRYDFRMGRKLKGHAENAGFTVLREFDVEDREFSFVGPADPEVITAWQTRFERMKLLEQFCGSDFPRIRDDFLACLAREDHRSDCRVVTVLAQRPHSE